MVCCVVRQNNWLHSILRQCGVSASVRLAAKHWCGGDGVPQGWPVEPVNIEQVMLFLTRGEDAK